MGQQEYTEEELLAKKYTDLFKISKALGIKTARRLKTDKLIEAILKGQREEAAGAETAAEALLSQDAEAVMKALGGGGTQEKEEKQEEEEEEMLLDVQFPECGSQDSLSSLSDATNTSSGATEASAGPEASKTATPAKRHKRSGTYDVDEEEEKDQNAEESKQEEEQEQETEKSKQEEQETENRNKEEEQKVKTKEQEQETEKNEEEEEKKDKGKRGRKKQERSSTFDLSISNDATLPIDEKETEENSQQLNQLLASKVTVRGSRRQGTPSTQGKGDTKATPRLSLTPAAKRQRRSVVITPSAPAPALRPSRKSRGTPVGSPALTKASTTTTTTTTAVSSKPVFNIGRGDSKVTDGAAQEDKQGGKGASSGIPRFLSYARRLKVPNFARIHKQAFQRMEGLDDYVDKRKARLDTHGSTTKKLEPKAQVFQPSVTTVKNLNLNFAAEGSSGDSSSSDSGTVESDGVQPIAPSPAKPLSAVPHRPSPMSARRASANVPRTARVSQRPTRYSVKPGKPRVSSAKPDLTRKSQRVTSKASPKSTKKASPKPTMKASPKTIPRQKTSPKAGHKGSPQTGRKSQVGQGPRPSLKPVSSKKVSAIGLPVFGAHLKENEKPGKQFGLSPMIEKESLASEVASPGSVRKRMQDYSRSLASRGTGYQPYKGAVKPLKDRNELKTMAERKHKVKSSKEIREGQRGILKGVRLNKRFELQMANRGITL